MVREFSTTSRAAVSRNSGEKSLLVLATYTLPFRTEPYLGSAVRKVEGRSPPPSRDHPGRDGIDTPPATAASSLESSSAISRQNEGPASGDAGTRTLPVRGYPERVDKFDGRRIP
jgi:hypothetical protein